MKKTINVNVGSVAFTMDEDAYHALSRYYDDIRSRLYESERQEVLYDVEVRTADIFSNKLSYPAQVVNLDMVRLAIATIGSADSFGEQRYDFPPVIEEYPRPESSRKLYRSRSSRMIAGVCGGFAEYFNISAAPLRIIVAILVFISGGGVAIVYLILWLLIPQKPLSSRYFGRSKYKQERRYR